MHWAQDKLFNYCGCYVNWTAARELITSDVSIVGAPAALVFTGGTGNEASDGTLGLTYSIEDGERTGKHESSGE